MDGVTVVNRDIRRREVVEVVEEGEGMVEGVGMEVEEEDEKGEEDEEEEEEEDEEEEEEE